MKNEILEKVLETDEYAIPRYNIEDVNGKTLFTNIAITLQNAIKQAGTMYAEETVLTEEVANEFGFTKDAVPNDIFRALIATLSYTWKLIAVLDNTGDMAGTWTAPDVFDTNNYDLGIYEIGGGGAGALCSSTSGTNWASGGASGYGKNFIIQNVSPGDQFEYVIGAGGQGKSGTSTTAWNGASGGTTSFNGVTAFGGSGGLQGQGGTKGASGGQGSDAAIDTYIQSRRLYGCCSPVTSNSIVGGQSQAVREGQNQFDNSMITLSAGGMCNGYSSKSQAIVAMPDGTKGGNGGYMGEDATGYGNGGGSSVSRANAQSKSGSGSDGVIFIYARRRKRSVE